MLKLFWTNWKRARLYHYLNQSMEFRINVLHGPVTASLGHKDRSLNFQGEATNSINNPNDLIKINPQKFGSYLPMRWAAGDMGSTHHIFHYQDAPKC